MKNFRATYPSWSLGARSRSRGVGLIEVMIAMLILAIGFLALASLQTAATRSAAEARARTASVNLASDKLEEMRTFLMRLSDANADGTRDRIIDTNGDGLADAVGESFDRIVAGNDTPNEVGSGTTGYTFTRNWTAVPCRVAPAGTVACGGTITAATADFMRVAVRVTWASPDIGAATQEVVVEDLISSSTPIDAAVAMSNPAIDRESPKVYIQPARIQSTIPIAIGEGLESAASDPQPTIIRDNVVRTQFEVLTFSTEGDGDLLAERAFDYTVVGCECTLEGIVSGKRSYEPTVWNGLTFSRPREVVNDDEHPDPNIEGDVRRVTARANLRNNDPPVIKDLCTACCRDHHDTTITSTPRLDPTKPDEDDVSTPDINENQYLANGDHRHYMPVLSGGQYSFVEATTAGNQYYETCRFLRRDGFYRLTMDAHLVDLAVFRQAELDEVGETDEYADYARQLIDSYVNRAAANGSSYPDFDAATMAAIYDDARVGLSSGFLTKLDPVNPYPLPSPGLQLLSRGIYVDYMTPEVLAAIRCKINNTPDTPACLPYRSSEKLELVPFFAVGMTRLNSWEPTVDTVARMPLRDAGDPFSRGWAVPRSVGQSRLVADSAVTNIGLTNPIPGTELEQALVIDDSIPVEVGLVAELPPERIVVRFTLNRANDTLLDDPGVVLLSGLGVECLATGQHAGAFSWSCSLSSTGRGTVIFSNYTGTECVQRDGGTCVLTAPVRNRVCFSPLPSDVNRLTQSNAYRDTTEAVFDGSQSANAEYAVDIIPGGQNCPNSDEPPGVSATDPAHGATNVSSSTGLTVTFNEPVNTTTGAVTLTCDGGTNLITGGTVGSGVTQLTPTFAGTLPLSATCTLTVLAANVSDVDVVDPPNNMGANYTATFVVSATNDDTAPTITSVDTSVDGQIVVNFSEAITTIGAAITLSCDEVLIPIISGASSSTPTSTLTARYVGGTLPRDSVCTVTISAAAVIDADTNDPPDNMLADYVHVFDGPVSDAAPTVVSSRWIPEAGETAFTRRATFEVVFSEPVNGITINGTDASTVTLYCGNTTQRITGGSLDAGRTILTLTQRNTGSPSFPCTLTVKANGITDADSNDLPYNPDNMAADYVRIFTN